MIYLKKYLIVFFIYILSISFIYSDDAINYYKSGKRDFFNEDYESAIYNYKKALELNPNYVEPLIDLSKLYYELELYDYSYKYITKALKLIPDNDEYVIFCADIETQLKMYNLAEKKYKSVLSKDPLNIDAQIGLANLYLMINNMILAKKSIDNVLKIDPNNFNAILLSAKYYENIDRNKAEKYYLLNIEKNSLNPDSYYYYSIFNFIKKNINDAVTNIKIAINIKDRAKFKKYYGKYLLYLKKGDEALNIFREVVKNDKNNYLLYYYLAHSYFLISDYDKSLESLNRVLNLRDDDEFASFFFNQILIEKYKTDDYRRKKQAEKYYSYALKSKKNSEYSLYIYFLKEAIKLYPKLIEARIDLANYFLYLDLPERYLRELKVASKYTDDKNLQDRIEVEKKRISYRLGDDWDINQYAVEQDLIKIPVFLIKNIENIHYGSENIFFYILENSLSEKMKYSLNLYDDIDYDTASKMRIAKNLESPFYLNINLNEKGSAITVLFKLYNSYNNELIKEYKTSKSGNNKVVISALKLADNLNDDLTFKSHILKISKDSALINAGRRSGIKLKDKFVIIDKKDYYIDFNKTTYRYSSNDIKGYAIAVKVDENITELKLIENELSKDIDIGDIVIYKK